MSNSRQRQWLHVTISAQTCILYCFDSWSSFFQISCSFLLCNHCTDCHLMTCVIQSSVFSLVSISKWGMTSWRHLVWMSTLISHAQLYISESGERIYNLWQGDLPFNYRHSGGVWIVTTQTQEMVASPSKHKRGEPGIFFQQVSGRTASALQVLLLPHIPDATLFLFPSFHLSLTSS